MIYTLTAPDSDARAVPETDRAAMNGAIWYETENVCALASAERHLGHIEATAQGWIAYDGTHTNPAGDGFDELGRFRDAIQAQAAVEAALGFRRRPWERESAAAPLTM